MERYKCFFLTDEKILKCSQNLFLSNFAKKRENKSVLIIIFFLGSQHNVKQSMARMPTMCVLTSKELTSKQSECVR
jgi:hypothetical protein